MEMGKQFLRFMKVTQAPKVQCWLIHSSCLSWAQQGHTVVSQFQVLTDTWKRKQLKDKQNNTGEEKLKEMGMFNFQKKAIDLIAL